MSSTPQTYYDRRAEGLKRLGGKCACCGIVPETLSSFEFDHIDPTTKEFTISGGKWNTTDEKFYNELDKCQILCKACHHSKTIKSRGQQEVKGKDVHGTLSSYRYCKCNLCKSAKSKHSKEYKQKKKFLKLLKLH